MCGGRVFGLTEYFDGFPDAGVSVQVRMEVLTGRGLENRRTFSSPARKFCSTTQLQPMGFR